MGKLKKTEEQLNEDAMRLGKHYKLIIPGAGEPLYVATLAEMGALMREMYPNAKGWQVTDLRK